jgi:hypothetical protein
MGVQGWVSLLNWPGTHSLASGSASTSTASPGTVISPSPDYSQNANTLEPGAWMRITAYGQAVTGTTTANATFALYWGGTAGTQLLLSAATQIGAVTTAQTVPWRYEALLQFRTIGTSGTVRPYGRLEIATAAAPASTATTVANLFPLSAPGNVTVDTTVAKTLVLSAWVSTATGSPSVTCDEYLLEGLNC